MPAGIVDMGAERVERDSLLVQQAVDAVLDIGLKNKGCSPVADAHIAFRPPAGRGRVGTGLAAASALAGPGVAALGHGFTAFQLLYQAG